MVRPILRVAVGNILAATALTARIAATALPRPTSLSERLAAFPKHDLPLEAPATIHWNEHQVPFVEAQTDLDLAFVLGLVHAHLRLAQMEMFRRICKGRLSELVGPIAIEIDHALRLLNFGRAAKSSIAAMPDKTRNWLDAFVAGINKYIAQANEPPHEFAALGLESEAWTIADIVSIGRLVASDINWSVWFRLLHLRGNTDWSELWRSVMGNGDPIAESRANAAHQSPLLRFLTTIGERGSNAVAVGKSRSASGASLLAGDPHLPLLLPNIWLVCGCRSPSDEAVGLMLPGLPFIAIGRNPWIAWGGTNAHALASELVDVSELEPSAATVRREDIAVRWWKKETIEVRETAFGPIITDAKLFKSGRKETLALRWLGHQPSDEFTAMLRLGRARNWEEFRAAFENFAIPGQNVIYADQEGHIGKMIAAKVPARQPGAPADLATPARHASWDQFITGADLPFVHNPAEGLVVSANEPPAEKPYTLGYFFSLRDRAQRLTDLLSPEGTVAIEDLAAVLTDVYSPSAIVLRDALLPVLRAQHQSARSAKRRHLVEEFAAWDGRYTPDSVGALAFELLIHYFIPHFLGRARAAAFAAIWDARRLILRDVEAAPSERIAAALIQATGSAARKMSRYRNWGDIHRLRLAHGFGLAPIVGQRYRFADRPAGGGSETVFKTAHDAVARRHPVLYGSVARYFFDLSDLDRNYFVLLGGQDGWLRSSTFLDQVPLWETNRSVQVPLCRETMHMTFRHKTPLIPEGHIRNTESRANAAKATLV